MRNTILFAAFLICSTPAFASKSECVYQMDPSTLKVNWTAFKTTEKVAVQGTVHEVKVVAPKKAKSLSSFLKGVAGSGAFDAAEKSNSGNPGRDQTVFQKFFSLFAKKGQFKGGFATVKGDDTAGKMNLSMSVNSKKGVVPMEYKLGADGVFEATGSFDMLDFGMKNAHASIHQACEELHKGKDGVSKTWTEIGLKITAVIKKECAEK
jgi:hypothetical protein